VADEETNIRIESRRGQGTGRFASQAYERACESQKFDGDQIGLVETDSLGAYARAAEERGERLPAATDLRSLSDHDGTPMWERSMREPCQRCSAPAESPCVGADGQPLANAERHLVRQTDKRAPMLAEVRARRRQRQ
jgi:hypothetical protein